MLSQHRSADSKRVLASSDPRMLYHPRRQNHREFHAQSVQTRILVGPEPGLYCLKARVGSLRCGGRGRATQILPLSLTYWISLSLIAFCGAPLLKG